MMYPAIKPIVFNKPELDKIELFVGEDLHIGNECCDVSKINRFINYILADPHRFVVFNGDLMENAIPGSKSDPLTQTMSPQEQQDFVAGMFAQLKDRIIAIDDGNHESNRSIRMAGLYPLYTAAAIAGVSDKYRSAYAILDIGVGRGYARHENWMHRYVGYMCHRYKEMKSFSTAHMLEGFDFVIGGHDHEPIDHARAKLCYDRRSRSVSFKDVEVVNSGACLHFGGYSARGGMAPKASKIYYLILNGVGPDNSIDSHGTHI